MGGSSSRQDTSTSSQTLQTSRNLNLQDTSGVTIADNAGPVTFVSSDMNAIGDAVDLANSVAQIGADNLARTTDLIQATNNGVLGLLGNQSDAVLSYTSDINATAIDAVGSAQDNALKFGGDALSSVGDAFRTFAASLSGAFGNANDNALNLASNSTERAIAAVVNSGADNRAFAGDVLSNVSDFAKGIFGTSLGAIADLQKQSQTQLGNTTTALNEIARQSSTSTDQRVADVSTNALKVAAVMVALVAAAFIFKKS